MADEPRGKKSALLIGINQYNSDAMPDLHGCVADVSATETFLEETAKISKIIKLTSPASSPDGLLPTLDNVHGAFRTLASEAGRGDFIYIHYSGHGTRLPTSFPSLKSNVYDECLVLPGVNRKLDHLRDVEVAFLLKKITDKGATVTLVLDCCHSGGATRDGDDDVKNGIRGSDNIPPEAFVKRDLIGPAPDLEVSWKPPAPGDPDRGAVVIQHWMTALVHVSFLAACMASQKAQEIPRGAQVKQGLLTACLVSVLNDERVVGRLDQLSCDVVYNLVAGRLKNHPQRNLSSEQDAVFGGQRNRFFFGVDRVSQPAVVIQKVDELGQGRVRVELSAGSAHGVREGDEYAIYPAGKPLRDLTDYSESLAACRVTAVEDFAAPAMLQPGAAKPEKVQANCVAVSTRDILKKHVLEPRGVRVSSASESPGPLEQKVQEVRDSINRDNKLVRLADTDDAFFAVHVQTDGSFAVSFNPNQAEAKVMGGTAIKDLLSRLAHLVIFYNLFSLSVNARQSGGIEVCKIGFLDEGVEPPYPQPFSLDSPPRMPRLRPSPPDSINIAKGQSLGIQVRNTSYKALYIEILDLEPSWMVSRAYPLEGDSPIQLDKGEGANFFIETSMSEEVPGSIQPDTFDRILILATPRDQLNFPEVVLPKLGGGEEHRKAPPVLDGDGDGRSGRGVPQPAWSVRHLDMRVVEHGELAGN